MPAWLILGSWVVVRALRSPIAWFVALTLAMLCPLFTRLAPLGETVHGVAAGEAALDWSRPVAWFAVSAGIVWLTSAERLLERSAWITRGLAEWTALGAVVLLTWLPLWLGAALGAHRLGISPAAAATELVAELAFAVALGALALRFRLPVFGRVLGFLLLVWVAPALLAGTPLPAVGLLFRADEPGPASALTAALAIAAWLALDLALLAPRSAR